MCNLKKINVLFLLSSSMLMSGEEDLKKIHGFVSDGFPTELEQKQVNSDLENTENLLEQADDDSLETSLELEALQENDVIKEESSPTKSKEGLKEELVETTPTKKSWSTKKKVITGLVTTGAGIAALFGIKVAGENLLHSHKFNRDMLTLFQENINKLAMDTKATDEPSFCYVTQINLFDFLNEYITQKGLNTQILNPLNKGCLAVGITDKDCLSAKDIKIKIKNTIIPNSANVTNGEIVKEVVGVEFTAKADEMLFRLIYYIAAKNAKKAALIYQDLETSLSDLEIESNYPITEALLSRVTDFIQDYGYQKNGSNQTNEWEMFAQKLSKELDKFKEAEKEN